MSAELPEETPGCIDVAIEEYAHPAPYEDEADDGIDEADDGIDDDGMNVQMAVDIFGAEGIPARHILVHPFITILPLPWEAPSFTPDQGTRLLEAATYKPMRLRRRGVRSAARQMLPEPAGRSSSLVHRSPLTGRQRTRVIISANSAIVPVPGCIVLSPGLLVRCPCGTCRNPIAVEIDGTWWSDTPEGRRAQHRRDAEYQEARIGLITIPAYEYPQQTWAGVLQKKIRSHLHTTRLARRT